MSRRSPVTLLFLGCLTVTLGGWCESAGGQASPQAFEVREVVGAVDRDDDDEDGRYDAEQPIPPLDDALSIAIDTTAPAPLRFHGGLRVFRGTAELQSGDPVAPGTLSVIACDEAGGVLQLRGSSVRVRGQRLRFEGAEGLLDPRRDALRPTRRIPNDATLTRRDGEAPVAGDVRLVADGASHATLVSIDASGRIRDRLELRLRGGRSPWLRLVTDALDQGAPGVGGRVLRVALRDRVEARVGDAHQSMRIGRPGSEEGPLAARRGRLRVRVLTHHGVPAVGSTERRALLLGAEQVAIANEIYAQCLIDFGAPEDADVALFDPAEASLLSIGDPLGLPALGGTLRARVAGHAIRVEIPPGTTPLRAALRVAEGVRETSRNASLIVRVRANPRTDRAADRSADVEVREGGRLLRWSRDGNHPLTTDARQASAIGAVDLSDGLHEFSNANAAAGTLEERTLLYALGDDDPTTIELVIVNAFTRGSRRGEAFIESDGGALANAVLIDRSAIRHQRGSWTQAHELGHLLLDHPFHPDDLQDERPWLLMRSGGNEARVTGPKRLTDDDCARIRDRSGVHAHPPLLVRHPL